MYYNEKPTKFLQVAPTWFIDSLSRVSTNTYQWGTEEWILHIGHTYSGIKSYHIMIAIQLSHLLIKIICSVHTSDSIATLLLTRSVVVIATAAESALLKTMIFVTDRKWRIGKGQMLSIKKTWNNMITSQEYERQ